MNYYCYTMILPSLCVVILFVCAANSSCPDRCKPTCAVPNPKNCRANKNCSCPNDFDVYLSRKNLTCIPVYQCPQNGGCNGDKNAVIQERVLPNASTCKNPNQVYSSDITIGCVCKSGYILSKKGGKCIPTDCCPGGNPCGKNHTFASCTACPYNPCPFSEDPVFFACDPIFPCPSGCICASGYKSNGGQCLLPQDCPPVTCTRVNEEWDRCPSPCFSDSCADVSTQTGTCQTLVPAECNPRCRCKTGFARDSNNTCIPVEECPPPS